MHRPAPLVAVLALSAAAHAAVVLITDWQPPVAPVARSDEIRRIVGDPLQLRIRSSMSVKAEPKPAGALPRPRATPIFAPEVLVPPGRMAPDPVEAPDEAVPTTLGQDQVVRPVPLTYPVIPIPPDDDPSRVGLVRLTLVVSSEGDVVQTFVTVATLSQDYVDRIQRSFEKMHFKPAMARGLPRAGWYEVVVHFDFDPATRTTL